MSMSTCQQATEATQQFWVPHHLRIAVTPTGVVALDLKRNRYHGLGLTSARELAALASNWSHVSFETEALEPLSSATALPSAPVFLKAGWLTFDPPEIAFNVTSVDLTAQITSIGFQQQSDTAIRPHYIANFTRACLWSKRAFRSRTLYSVACEISAAKAQMTSSPNLQRTIELACIFRRLRPYAFEANDRCLFHALALWNFLARYGSHATWVIGVCAHPWAAHSWLQLENCILDSSPEEVCRFTPIVAI